MFSKLYNSRKAEQSFKSIVSFNSLTPASKVNRLEKTCRLSNKHGIQLPVFFYWKSCNLFEKNLSEKDDSQGKCSSWVL